MLVIPRAAMTGDASTTASSNARTSETAMAVRAFTRCLGVSSNAGLDSAISGSVMMFTCRGRPTERKSCKNLTLSGGGHTAGECAEPSGTRAT